MELETIDSLCEYLGCGVGDWFEYVSSRDQAPE
ncbi:MAG: helix-turn-helix domain-containing protein [Acidithiobacillus sp.]|nr:helix-turn-helix domain-containing protein [Acidithiobacillus sp.]